MRRRTARITPHVDVPPSKSAPTENGEEKHGPAASAVPLSRYDAETQRALRLFVVLSRCQHSLSEQLRRDIVQHGLGVSEFGVLEMLYHKGPLPLGVIAEKILLTSGSITYTVNQLVRQGLVRRVGCPADRRRQFAELTDTGRELLARIFPQHAERIRALIAALSAEEQETAIQLLKRLGLSADERSD